MVRHYKRALGSRQYKNYRDEALRDAVRHMNKHKMTLRDAAEKFGIPKSSLANALKGKHCEKIGRAPVFSQEEEDVIVAYLVSMSTFGFPLTGFDLRCVVKSYLDKLGRKEIRFKNNCPGRDWAQCFIKRHRDIISQRTAKNITYGRAATNKDVVNSFFDNLEKELEGIPPSNIWNYDETNLVDDPGAEKVITRRGTKYPERIRNSSKANTSIMVCGNAEGRLAPLYVNYKSEKMWDTWTQNGPVGCRYNRSKSGWFDGTTFQDWFISAMLPILRRQEGTKALIGDNLSSHISVEVLRLCELYGIKFLALPPNATHLLQPLDVAVFRALKIFWREILNAWKQSESGSRCTAIPKDVFPALLKQLMDKLDETIATNLQSGFKKTGICPLNRGEVLKRMPSSVMEEENSELSEIVGQSFIEHLEKRREDTISRRCAARRKKLNVPAGKSISSEDVPARQTQPSTSSSSKKRPARRQSLQECSEEESSPSTPPIPRPARRRRPQATSDEDSSDSSCESSSDFDGEVDSFLPANGTSTPTAASQQSNAAVDVGKYVLVNFEGTLYPGKVVEKQATLFMITAMERSGAHWKWPRKEDTIAYSPDEVVQEISPPTQLGRRGIYSVPELDTYTA